jgi:hypothetical protein
MHNIAYIGLGDAQFRAMLRSKRSRWGFDLGSMRLAHNFCIFGRHLHTNGGPSSTPSLALFGDGKNGKRPITHSLTENHKTKNNVPVLGLVCTASHLLETKSTAIQA